MKNYSDSIYQQTAKIYGAELLRSSFTNTNDSKQQNSQKNLPLPDVTALQEKYVAPETETEIKRCNFLAQLFEVESGFL